MEEPKEPNPQTPQESEDDITVARILKGTAKDMAEFQVELPDVLIAHIKRKNINELLLRELGFKDGDVPVEGSGNVIGSNNIVEGNEGKSLTSLTIAGLFLQKQQKELYQFLAMSAVFGFLYFLAFALGMPLDFQVLWLLLIPVGLLIARNALISYRISNGYFGNNRHEAQQLIEFVEQMDDTSPPSGGGNIKPFPETTAKREYQASEDSDLAGEAV